jgi:hypothetical protein
MIVPLPTATHSDVDGQETAWSPRLPLGRLSADQVVPPLVVARIVP